VKILNEFLDPIMFSLNFDSIYNESIGYFDYKDRNPKGGDFKLLYVPFLLFRPRNLEGLY
jgi:hypothetical protein